MSELQKPSTPRIGHMRADLTVVAATALNADFDFPCIDEGSGLPFRPRFVTMTMSDEDGGGTFNTGSEGRASLTDGMTVGRQGCSFVQVVAAVYTGRHTDIYTALWIVPAGNGFGMATFASALATTVRFRAITKFGAGFEGRGTFDVWGLI
jgi:hypothetical protein